MYTDMCHITSSYLIAIILIGLTVSGNRNNKQKNRKTRSHLSSGCGSNTYYPSTNEYYDEYLIHDGMLRTYLTHLPSSYDHDSNDGYPLILNFHGAASNSREAMAWTLMNDHANQNNYIAIYPDATALNGTIVRNFGSLNDTLPITIWNDLGCAASPTADGPTCNQQAPNSNYDLIPDTCKDVFRCNYCDCTVDDVGFIDTLLDELEEKYCIDRSRIYVTGFSNGANMVQTLGCELNHRLAAIAPMHGQLVMGYNCSPKYRKKMPILNIWGTKDTFQPGDTIIATPLELLGQFRLSVYQVQYKYGQHNKCDVQNTKYVTIPTVSDGINDWQCVGYDQCDFDQSGDKTIDGMSCSWNGAHIPPVNWEAQDSQNRDSGLNVMWNFFKDKTKIPGGY